MKKNFVFYLIPSLTRAVLGLFLMVPLTTYYLNPKDFGIAAILSVIAALIAPLSSTGVSWVLSAYFYKVSVEERKELLFSILFLDFVLQFFWATLFVIGAHFLLPLLVKDYEVSYIFYFQLALCGLILNGLWPSISYALVLQKKAGIHAFFEIGQLVAGIISTILCLVVFKLTTVTLFIAPIASGAFVFVGGLWYIRNQIRVRFSRKWLLEIFKIGMPTIPTNLFEVVTNSIDRYFIQRWINLSQLGIYSHSMAYKLMFTMGTKAFSRSFVPEVLQTFSHDRDTAGIKKILTIWHGLLGVGGVFVCLFSYEIIDILTHGKFVAAAPLVPIWFLLALSHTFGIPYSQYLFLLKKTSFLVYSGIGVGAIFIGIMAISVYQFGVLGAVTAAVMSNATIQLSRRIYARKLGCSRIGEKGIIIVATVLMSVYVAEYLFVFNFFLKIAVFFALSIFMARHFMLFETARNNWRKVFGLHYI